ncbi:MAG: 23S rRNA (guanosine(2251)-2'-O)-methyltransferase RlmB [Pseudomonadota bacterium]
MSGQRYSAGIHAARRALARGPKRVRRVLIDTRSDNTRLSAVAEEAQALGIAVEPVRRQRLDQLAGGARHQGVIVELDEPGALDESGLRTLVEQTLTADEDCLLVYLDEVQDPHNLGAVLRSVDAAGALAVVAPRERASGLTPVVRKTASGAAESVAFAQVADPARMLDWLGQYGVKRLVAAEAAPANLYSADLTGPLLLALGNEERGVRPHLARRCDAAVSIPMRGTVESLNVSVAAALCLYEARRQRESLHGQAGSGTIPGPV